jgi:hypothetical protein
MCTYALFLGLRLTLRPRLYSAARIRGLRTRQNVGNDKALGIGGNTAIFSTVLTKYSSALIHRRGRRGTQRERGLLSPLRTSATSAIEPKIDNFVNTIFSLAFAGVTAVWPQPARPYCIHRRGVVARVDGAAGYLSAGAAGDESRPVGRVARRVRLLTRSHRPEG